MKRYFTVLKKFAAVMTALAVVLSCSAAVLADDSAADLKIESGDPIVKSINTSAISTEARGIYGKAADDKSYQLDVVVQDTNQFYRTFYSVKPADDYATNYKYLVYEANIAPVSGVKSVYLQTTSSAQVSQQVTSGFDNGQWNHFMFVYEVPTADHANGRTTCYVNGEKVLDNQDNTKAFVNTDVRLAIDSKINSSDSRQDIKAYIDDINAYLTNTEPTASAMPELDSTKYTISGSKLTVADSTKLSSITADGVTVRGYRGDTALTAESELLTDDKVVLESGTAAGNMKYTTYTVSVIEPETYVDFAENAGVDSTNTTKEPVTNFGGKSESDKLFRVKTAEGSAGNIGANWNHVKSYNGYLVIEGNAYIEKGSFDVRFVNIPFTNTFNKIGSWFHFEIVVDKSKTSDNVSVYVDGKLAYSPLTKAVAVDTSHIRLRLEKNSSVIFDDVQLYPSKTAPQITQLPTLQSTDLLIDKYVNGSGKTAESLASGNVSAAAFTSSDLTTAEAVTGNLSAGNYVLIYDSEKRIYNGYTVAEYANDGSKITYKYPEDNVKIIIAEYSGGNLVGAAFGDGGAEYTVKDAANSIKVFTLDSFDNIKPLEKVIE